jgi:hypothetical protein
MFVLVHFLDLSPNGTARTTAGVPVTTTGIADAGVCSNDRA